jgi:uncharacterized protein
VRVEVVRASANDTPDHADPYSHQTAVGEFANANCHIGVVVEQVHDVIRDDTTIVFADYAGNRQYITQGNLLDSAKAHLFLIDYAHKQRVKIWGTAHVVQGDRALEADLMPEGYGARVEQVIVFKVTAWSAKFRFESTDVAAALSKKDEQIMALQAELVPTQQRP